MKRHGKITSEILTKRNPARGCEVQECLGKHFGKGLCQKHYNKAYRENPENKVRIAKLNAEFVANNRESQRKYHLNYYQQNKAQFREYQRNWEREQLANDPSFKLARILRRRILHWLIDGAKSESTTYYLGADIQTAKLHIEKQFKPGMTWENHGPKGWHIDHIRPVASFDLSDPEQVKQAFHYTNLQPLWWHENLSKGKRLSEVA